MLQSPVRLPALLALLISCGPQVGCGTPADTTGGTSGGGQGGSSTTGSGGATSAGGSGDTGGIPAGGSGQGGAGDCPRLEGGAETVVVEGTPAQAYCDGTAVNPPECPVVEAEPASPCSPTGTVCGYQPVGEAVTVSTCNADGQWQSRVLTCNATCAPALPDDAVVAAPSCGSLPDTLCDDNPGRTDQERATSLLRDVLSCCGNWTETLVDIQLEGGCAVAVHVDGGGSDSGFGECVRALLAGRRFSCATGLSCIHEEWSTVL